MQSFPGNVRNRVLHERKHKGEHLPTCKTHGRWTKREKRAAQAMIEAREELERMGKRTIFLFFV